MKNLQFPRLFWSFSILLGLWVQGCSKTDNPVLSGSAVPVNLTASFSKSGAPLLKTAGTAAVDSIRIDSLVVVVEKIKLFSDIDTVSVDSSGEGDDHEGHDSEGEDESALMFRGPFVIHVRDTLAVDFASQVVPAGTYNGVSFKVHRLRSGEHHEDSDERHGRMSFDHDSSITGSSIVVWGAVRKEGTWTPFVLNLNMELQVKIRGNFVVPEAARSLQFAFTFDLGLLFRDPHTGELLDLSDSSPSNLRRIAQAIRSALGHGWGGHDDDHDGHPDH